MVPVPTGLLRAGGKHRKDLDLVPSCGHDVDV